MRAISERTWSEGLIMANADLYRLASVSTWLALVALILSGIALGLFFGGAGELWGPVNDAFIVVTAIALLPAVLAVARLAGDRGAPWVAIVSVAAIAGLVLMAVGQTLLIVGRLSLEGSFVTGGIGVVPFLAWVLLLAVLGIGLGVLPARTGWLSAAVLVSIVAATLIATVTSGPVWWVLGVAELIVLSVWLADLALALGAAAEGVAGVEATA
jgi:hypothetical protein